MLRQVLSIKVFWRASRSRRDCGNLEADLIGNIAPQNISAAVAATAAILRRYIHNKYEH